MNGNRIRSHGSYVAVEYRVRYAATMGSLRGARADIGSRVGTTTLECSRGSQ